MASFDGYLDYETYSRLVEENPAILRWFTIDLHRVEHWAKYLKKWLWKIHYNRGLTHFRAWLSGPTLWYSRSRASRSSFSKNLPLEVIVAFGSLGEISGFKRSEEIFFFTPLVDILISGRGGNLRWLTVGNIGGTGSESASSVYKILDLPIGASGFFPSSLNKECLTGDFALSMGSSSLGERMAFIVKSGVFGGETWSPEDA